MWVMRWKQHAARADIPNTLVDALYSCSELYLRVLLRVALTLPITSCESGRSFSQLKLIKTSHHSTMTNNRLTGLTLMKINRDYCNELSSEERIKGKVVIFTSPSKEDKATLHAGRVRVNFCAFVCFTKLL